MNRRVQRRALTAILVTTGLALTGCATASSAQDQPELTDEDVTLTLNWWGADARTQGTIKAIELFEEEYPNITVEPQYADWTGYWDRLATNTAGGDMPDVSQFDQLYLASYADRGTLLDLDTVSNTLDTSVLSPEILDTGTVGGVQYAVPVGATANGVILNKSVFDTYGIEVPDFTTWTWDEFDALAEEVSEKSSGAVSGVGAFGGDSFTLGVWARQNGENVFDDDGDMTVSPEVVASYWDKVLSWVDSGAAQTVEQISEGVGLPLDQNSVTLGTTAMSFIPAGQFTAYQSAAPDTDFVLGNWPTDSDTSEGFQYLKPSMYWVASSQSEHPAEAALLIDFLTTDTEVAKVFGTDRGVPANPEFQEAITPQLDASGVLALDFTAAITELVGEAPPITPNGASDIETIQARYNQRVLFEELTPQEAAAAFIDEVQASIDAAS